MAIIKKLSAKNKNCFRYKDVMRNFLIRIAAIFCLHGKLGHVNEIKPGFALHYFGEGTGNAPQCAEEKLGFA
jgi:hypothetical protein